MTCFSCYYDDVMQVDVLPGCGRKKGKLMLHRYCVSNLWSHDILCINLWPNKTTLKPFYIFSFGERFSFFCFVQTESLRKMVLWFGRILRWSLISREQSENVLIFSGCLLFFSLFFLTRYKKAVKLFHPHCYFAMKMLLLYWTFIPVCDFVSVPANNPHWQMFRW